MVRRKDSPPLSSVTTSTATRVMLTVLSLHFILLQLNTFSLSKPTHHSLFRFLSNNATIARHLHYLTCCPQVAATPPNFDTTAYVLPVFSSSFATHSIFYYVYLSYLVRRSLTLSSTPPPSSVPIIAFDLSQEIYPGDPYAAAAAEVLPDREYNKYSSNKIAISTAKHAVTI